jgi:rhodanese-related sulfurtransferase
MRRFAPGADEYTSRMIAAIPHTDPPPPSTIGPDELNRLISNGADLVIVDVRNARILDHQGWATVPSATLIPLEELETRVGELPKDKLIVTTCMTGFRSEPARAFLEREGFERVAMARLDEYLAKGFPTVPVERPAQ